VLALEERLRRTRLELERARRRVAELEGEAAAKDGQPRGERS
jgi:hypothetical protein